jgi:hypothetical protein
MSNFLNWEELHAELGAQNKAQSDAAEANAAERIKRQIASGLRDKDGLWIGQDALAAEEEDAAE